MRQAIGWFIGAAFLVGAGPAWAHDEGKPEAGGEHVLTGEVVDVFCYLSHGEKGLGAGHATCAQHCIQNGLPVAIKVGDQLYLATMTDHNAANAKLADLAGHRVTVHGTILEGDGQHVIAISNIEAAE